MESFYVLDGKVKFCFRNINASAHSSGFISCMSGSTRSHSLLNVGSKKSSSISYTPESEAASLSCSSVTSQPKMSFVLHLLENHTEGILNCCV